MVSLPQAMRDTSNRVRAIAASARERELCNILISKFLGLNISGFPFGSVKLN